MPKGGYKLLDLKGSNFTAAQNTVVLPGVYESVEASNGKPILVTNFSIDKVERLSFFAAVSPYGNSFYVFYRATNTEVTTFEVKSTDEVRMLVQKYSGVQSGEPVSGEDGPSASM